jgi:hypothetical protein
MVSVGPPCIPKRGKFLKKSKENQTKNYKGSDKIIRKKKSVE